MSSNIKRKPAKVISIGKWSVAIFVDGSDFGLYSLNLRKNLSTYELTRAKERRDEHPIESLFLKEEDLPVTASLFSQAQSWIQDHKSGKVRGDDE